MLQLSEKLTPEALLATQDDQPVDEEEQRSRGVPLRTAVHGVAVYARAIRGAAEPPPRPGLPDPDLLAGMVPESRAALREKEWRSNASLIPQWYKMLLVGVATMGAAWGVTGSPQQALIFAVAGSALALGRQRELSPHAPAQAVFLLKLVTSCCRCRSGAGRYRRRFGSGSR